jgi:hypothetical protein
VEEGNRKWEFRREEQKGEEVFMDVGESGEVASVALCLIGGQTPRLRLYYTVYIIF